MPQQHSGQARPVTEASAGVEDIRFLSPLRMATPFQFLAVPDNAIASLPDRGQPRFNPSNTADTDIRTFAWLNRCRRLAKDFENLTRNGLAFLRLASIRLMLRKLCSHI